MTTRCKPGDLAVIIAQGHGRDPDVGKLVNVIELYTGQSVDGVAYQINTDGVVWVIESIGSPLMVQFISATTGQYNGVELHKRSVCRDVYLRPIRGDGVTDEVARERELQIS